MNVASSPNLHRFSIAMPEHVTFEEGTHFREQMLGAFEAGAQHLSIDLSSTLFMDSAGLGMLLVALKECRNRDVSLTLVRPRGEVKRILDLTRSAERFTIYDMEDE